MGTEQLNKKTPHIMCGVFCSRLKIHEQRQADEIQGVGKVRSETYSRYVELELGTHNEEVRRLCLLFSKHPRMSTQYPSFLRVQYVQCDVRNRRRLMEVHS